MPCSDITDRLEVVLGHDDALHSYTLEKLTCGAPVGQASLLLGWLQGRSAESILTLDGIALREACANLTAKNEFLHFKHLMALQEGLRVLLGKASGGPGGTCEATSVVAEPESIRLVASLRVDLITEKIKACGHCRSCGHEA